MEEEYQAYQFQQAPGLSPTALHIGIMNIELPIRGMLMLLT